MPKSARAERSLVRPAEALLPQSPKPHERDVGRALADHADGVGERAGLRSKCVDGK